MLAPHPEADALSAELGDAGMSCSVGESEAAVLLRKLATLGPVALSTTALQAPLSAVLGDPFSRDRFERCMREVAAIASADWRGPCDVAPNTPRSAASARSAASTLACM